MIKQTRCSQLQVLRGPRGHPEGREEHPHVPPHLPRLYTVQTSVLDVLLSSCLASSSEKRPSRLKKDLSSSLRKITFSKLEKNKLHVRSHISKYTFHMKTLFPPLLGRQALPSDEDLKIKTK